VLYGVEVRADLEAVQPDVVGGVRDHSDLGVAAAVPGGVVVQRSLGKRAPTPPESDDARGEGDVMGLSNRNDPTGQLAGRVGAIADVSIPCFDGM
jgi:hypothetical protein